MDNLTDPTRGKPLFIAFNEHDPSCGTPPFAPADNDDHYYGFFTNQHGEQWVFIYDLDAASGVVYGGDTGWANAYPVTKGNAKELILDAAERLWLQACWKAATNSDA